MIVTMENLSKKEYKALIKEAIGEWLDAKYSQVGKWTVHGFAALCISAIAIYLLTHGYVK